MEFVNNLTYMGYGMLGILIVMGSIIGVTVLLNFFSRLVDSHSKNGGDAQKED